MYTLQKLGGSFFTQHPKAAGRRLDTKVPQFRVVSIEPVESEKRFVVPRGPGFFVEYSLEDVSRVAPEGSNAYLLISAEMCEGGGVLGGIEIAVQFYRVEIDSTQQIAERVA